MAFRTCWVAHDPVDVLYRRVISDMSPQPHCRRSSLRLLVSGLLEVKKSQKDVPGQRTDRARDVWERREWLIMQLRI